ncbi:PREDICTED: uncharacterized protein LOC109175563 [Ipomoea nil]|uniref:uncharacterized protein LOC109175563 n=1 Tax=Ipomoea nil TaxID=35883 RepID=UPI000901B02A|nr:PREDICTED: uncharacterized protein LOC109175563 [Ipomoea nil]
MLLDLQRTMKSIVSTPPSSTKSSTTVESETRDSCYFPGCRKDANCNCSICIASMNATLDLMTESVQRSTLTKLSAVKRRQVSHREVPRSPVFFNSSSFSTPDSSGGRSGSVSSELDSGARVKFHEKKKRKERGFGCGVVMMRVLFGLGLVYWLEYGVSPMISGVLDSELSMDVVRNLSGKSWGLNGLNDWNERLDFLRNELQGLVDEEVSNCSSDNSVWRVNQDGLLLTSRCTLYKSITEEVSIWGWPLQTAGLLTAEYTSRSFTLLSGRLTEWKNGEFGYSVRGVNSSWTQGRWSSSAVQLDPNTWILEYSESPIKENAKLVSATMEFLKFKLARELEKMKMEFWSLSAFGNSEFSDLRAESFSVPT